MKKILMNLLMLLGLFNNINSMEEASNKRRKIEKEEEKGSNLDLDVLPNEIRYEVVKSIIKDNINSWNDIFNFDNESLKNDLDRVRLISKDFTVFDKEELNNFIKKLKKERFEYLFEQLKENSKNKYKSLSEEKLNKELTNLLNTFTSTFNVENFKRKLKECVRLIIAGANVDIANDHSSTALIIAAKQHGNIEAVKLLIYMGSNINIANKFGLTALMIAARYGNIKVVKLLIEMGADINVKNNNGWTALMYAQKHGHKDIVELLELNGAK